MGLEDFLNEFKDYINKPSPKSVKHKTGLIDYAILSMLDLKLNTVFGEIEVMIDVGKEFSSLAMYKDGISFYCEVWITDVLRYVLSTFEDMADYCEHIFTKSETYKHTTKDWLDRHFSRTSRVSLNWESNDNSYICELSNKGKHGVFIKTSVKYSDGCGSVTRFWGDKNFIQESRSEEWFLKSLEFALNKEPCIVSNIDNIINQFYDDEGEW